MFYVLEINYCTHYLLDMSKILRCCNEVHYNTVGKVGGGKSPPLPPTSFALPVCKPNKLFTPS